MSNLRPGDSLGFYYSGEGGRGRGLCNAGGAFLAVSVCGMPALLHAAPLVREPTACQLSWAEAGAVFCSHAHMLHLSPAARLRLSCTNTNDCPCVFPSPSPSPPAFLMLCLSCMLCPVVFCGRNLLVLPVA